MCLAPPRDPLRIHSRIHSTSHLAANSHVPSPFTFLTRYRSNRLGTRYPSTVDTRALGCSWGAGVPVEITHLPRHASCRRPTVCQPRSCLPRLGHGRIAYFFPSSFSRVRHSKGQPSPAMRTFLLHVRQGRTRVPEAPTPTPNPHLSLSREHRLSFFFFSTPSRLASVLNALAVSHRTRPFFFHLVDGL